MYDKFLAEIVFKNQLLVHKYKSVESQPTKMAKDHQLTAYSPHSELVVIPEVQINESTTMLNEFRNPEIIRRMSCDSVFSQPRRPSILVRPTSRRPTVNSIKESLFIK